MRNYTPNHKGISGRHMLPIIGDWLIIAACIGAAVEARNIWLNVIAIILVGTRQHALFISIHEATHWQLARNKKTNDWISDLFCAFPIFFDTEIFRRNHLAHHRHLNTQQDPDVLRKTRQTGWTLPAKPARVAMFIPAFVLAIGPKEILPVLWGFCGFNDLKRWSSERDVMVGKAVYYTLALAAILYLGIAKEFLLYWISPLLLVLPFIARVRNLAEHAVVSLENENNATREVLPSRIEAFLLSPHNVNYHLTHHKYPHIPFYHLKAAHAELAKSGEYDDAHINSAYFLPFKNSVLADVFYGPRPKAKRSNSNTPAEASPERKAA